MYGSTTYPLANTIAAAEHALARQVPLVNFNRETLPLDIEHAPVLAQELHGEWIPAEFIEGIGSIAWDGAFCLTPEEIRKPDAWRRLGSTINGLRCAGFEAGLYRLTEGGNVYLGAKKQRA